jgi:KDO2-lipid IV(A) lauroyltransferase
MLPYYGYRTAEAVVSALPHRAAYALGSVAAGVVSVSAGRGLEGLRDNLRHVLPDADEAALRKVVRRNVRNLVRSWIDVMEMGRARRSDDLTARVHPVDVDNMLTPLSRGRGAVIISLHLGSWELGLAAWNHRFGQMAVIAEKLEPPQLFERIVAARRRLGVQVIPIDVAAMRCGEPEVARRAGAAALRDAYRVLRGGGMVAVAIDRDLTGTGQPFPLFGGEVSIPVGAIDIAIRTGAAIVPVFLLRSGRRGDLVVAPCHPELVYDPDAPREEEVRRVTGELLEIVETVIREHPEQWHVLDPIWTASA